MILLSDVHCSTSLTRKHCLQNDFGGTNGMFGDIVNLNHRVALATVDAPSLAGVGISMEGIDQNPVYYAAALDAVWQLMNATDAREGLEDDDEASHSAVVSSNSSCCPNCCEPSCLCACGAASSLRGTVARFAALGPRTTSVTRWWGSRICEVRSTCSPFRSFGLRPPQFGAV